MLIRKFEEIHKEKKQSLIVISHQEKIISMADRIMVIDDEDQGGRTEGRCPAVFRRS